MYFCNNDSSVTFNVDDGPYLPERIELVLTDDGNTYDMRALCKCDNPCDPHNLQIVGGRVNIDLSVSHSNVPDGGSYIHVRRRESDDVLINEMLGEFNVVNDR